MLIVISILGNTHSEPGSGLGERFYGSAVHDARQVISDDKE